MSWCWHQTCSLSGVSTNHRCCLYLGPRLFCFLSLIWSGFRISTLCLAFFRDWSPGKVIERELMGAEEAHDILSWLAKEIAARLANFRPGTGAAGTAYVRVIHQEPSGRLLSLLEEHILSCTATSKMSLTPHAISNLINLLYGNRPAKQSAAGNSPGLAHLRDEAAGSLNSFTVTELLDLASGLANCEELEENFLQEICRAVDALTFATERSESLKSDRQQANGLPCVDRHVGRHFAVPKLLADFPEVMVISKPSGWSCATGIASQMSRPEALPRLSDFLGACSENIPLFQNASADHGLAHRLDIETSGAMLVGKTPRSYWRLRLEFCAQKVKRRYVALVHGHLGPLGIRQDIDEPLRLLRLPKRMGSRSVQSKSVVCAESGRPRKMSKQRSYIMVLKEFVSRAALQLINETHPILLSLQASQNQCGAPSTFDLERSWRLAWIRITLFRR